MELFPRYVSDIAIFVLKWNIKLQLTNCFQDTTTLTVYMTGCDLEKSFIFEKTVEVTSHKPFPIHV